MIPCCRTDGADWLSKVWGGQWGRAEGLSGCKADHTWSLSVFHKKKGEFYLQASGSASSSGRRAERSGPPSFSHVRENSVSSDLTYVSYTKRPDFVQLSHTPTSDLLLFYIQTEKTVFLKSMTSWTKLNLCPVVGCLVWSPCFCKKKRMLIRIIFLECARFVHIFLVIHLRWKTSVVFLFETQM